MHKAAGKAVDTASSTEKKTLEKRADKAVDYGYTVNDTNTPLHTVRNKGRQSLSYLTYIVDNYDHNLADTIAFIHSHKHGFPRAWHTDAAGYNNVNSLRILQTAYVQKQGYVNLRCNPEIGCPDELQMHQRPPEAHHEAEPALSSVWTLIMGDNTTVPDVIGVACCAQFAESKWQVRN
ncbi:MAG: hypothetical protein M1831_006960 [Alyxoria varia]|nr:MAG: hypothetical protein M1831_006960 [Alyxoria varia]